MRVAGAKTEETASTLNACGDAKFKKEPVGKLKEWSAWFKEEAAKLENSMTKSDVDHEALVKELENSDMQHQLEEAVDISC